MSTSIRTICIFLAMFLAAGCVAAPSQPPVTVVVTVVVTAVAPDNTDLLTGVSPLPLPDWPEEEHAEGSTGSFSISVDDVETLTETVMITFTLSGGIAQSPLFDAPTLEGVAPSPDSLEEAQFVLLRLATRGQVTASLEFPRPEGELPWLLVFNPEHEPDDHVAPRVEVGVDER